MVFEVTEGEIRRDFGGEGQLFYFGNEENFVVHPFFKRRISELPFSELLPPDSKEWFDIASPYGFCGPIAYIGEPEVEKKLWQDFCEEFHHYCWQNNIVTEFVRLHPYLKNHLPLSQLSQTDVRKMSEVAYVDLEQDVSLIRKNATKGNKSSVSKARRSGVEVFCSNTKEDLDAFHKLYIDTMLKNEAKESYFFSREFYDHLFRLLSKDIQLFSARYRDQVIAASLFLFKKDWAHYYLGGSDADFSITTDLRALGTGRYWVTQTAWCPGWSEPESRWWLNGLIDDFVIFPRNLSPAEISNFFDNLL